ncbi:deoxycytidyl transferase, partial [Ascosphaera atra]
MKKNPHLKEKPVAVAHGTGPGAEIASCNYPARSYGIKNGMWMKYAQQLCPSLTVVPYDFPGYEEASKQFYDVILKINGIVQSVSIDEALIDISGEVLSSTNSTGVGISEGSIYREQARADEIAKQLRDGIRASTGCEVSVGIGGNILQAKVALRKAKPAGQFLLKPEQVLDFIGKLT